MRITENLDLEIDKQRWSCHHCETDLGDANDNYKKGCLLKARAPEEIWQPHVDEEVNFSYHRDWCRLVEFYCPGCGWLVEVEVLPPGHPITHDIQLDLDQLSTVHATQEGAR